MNVTPKAYFISGVSGVGKSSTLKHLKESLPAEEFDIRDFDERGVPDEGGLEWHNSETRHWLDVANENATHGVSTIICGFAEPERFTLVHMPTDVLAQLILLNASADVLRDRLYGRYPTPESVAEINRAAGVPLEQFVENNISYAPQLKDIFEKENLLIIETDTKTPEQVTKELIKNFTNTHEKRRSI